MSILRELYDTRLDLAQKEEELSDLKEELTDLKEEFDSYRISSKRRRIKRIEERI